MTDNLDKNPKQYKVGDIVSFEYNDFNSTTNRYFTKLEEFVIYEVDYDSHYSNVYSIVCLNDPGRKFTSVTSLYFKNK